MASLLVDDVRQIEADVVARTYDDAVHQIHQQHFNVLYLDHDLGEEKDGFDFLKYCRDYDLVPNRVMIVSSNPVGRQNIENLLRFDLNYRKIGPGIWVK